MRLALASLVSLLTLAVCGRAAPITTPPFDPEILIATGGDATDITNAGAPVTVDATGGGIFVFHNATGHPLTELDLNLNFPDPFPAGFTVAGTIVVRMTPEHQSATFLETNTPGFDCSMHSSNLFTCVELVFRLLPGPLIDLNQNFVLDFNNPADFTAADFAIINGTYTGGNDTSGTGNWLGANGQPTSGTATPNGELPEPAYYGVTFLSLAALLLWHSHRRTAAVKQGR